ncbi:MAG: hypothetical protein QOE66_1350, partial [Chloroflexota bacterium]|nr:hypothetical protein [Chloroflexota bacterium]
RSIVEAVIALAHGLRITVVAEGIETEAQFELLSSMGCDVGQGYLFARPLPAVEAGRLLSASRSRGSTRAGPTDLPDVTPKPSRAAGGPRAARARPRPVAGLARTRPR